MAMADPSNVFAVDDIRAIAGAEVQHRRRDREPDHRDDRALLPRRRRSRRVVPGGRGRRTTTDARPLEPHRRSSRTRRSSSSSTCSSTQAVNDRASDIHVEPTEHDLRIRFRIDGVLHEVMRSPRSIQAGVISRLKVMADINIAERRVPQDGRITMKVSGRGDRPARRDAADGVRREGRHANPRQGPGACCRLEELGFLPEALERFETSYRKPYGTILVTGPTGSGKSTTLYATLNQSEHARPQHHHGRGPGRVPAARDQPGADQPQGRADLRGRRCDRSCVPTPTSSSSVRSATAKPRSSRSRRRSPVTSCCRRCTPTTPRRRRMRLVEMGVEPFLVTQRARLRRRAAPRAPALRQVQGAVPADRGRARRAPAGRLEDLTDGEWPTLLPGRRLPVVRAHRLPRSIRASTR